VAGQSNRNRRTVLGLLVVLAVMVGLTSASVPLYRLFCQATGYGGTTRVATSAPDQAGLPDINVRFNADVSPELPWSFYPKQREVRLPIGATKTIYYRAVNRSSQTVTGTATFNVTPNAAGQFFDKLQCFCFTEQTLKPGEAVDMAVLFFVDPKILDDADGRDIKTITLSYTFFRAKDQQAATAAVEATATASTN
jgi:cytochrome c oxidase assembly protein subunit 11